jgi:two-component system, NarL family, response regulator NreC
MHLGRFGLMTDMQESEIDDAFLTDSENTSGERQELTAWLRPIRVMLVDERVMMREGLAGLIEKEEGLTVIGQVSNLGSANELDTLADVIVTDIDQPDLGYGDMVIGIHAAFSESRILALSMVRHPAKVQYVLASGADGYLLKTATGTELINGIRALANGDTYLQPSLGVDLARWRRTLVATLELSSIEEQVLQLLALGNTNAEIARYLGVSLRTIETHRSRVYQKLGLKTRAELVQYARKADLIDDLPR